ncbi:hypothetical protein CC80DRAFT_201035 [Byssothecium circinans]|uniref:Uncharacterized protein n=1 Tax=Byssothecium circinans TaxID=147558 RepID=A0A6A5U9X0_9PLEO|nr:hypothetical protein CC80DRAFT_201035 [Byssothecium circinans]
MKFHFSLLLLLVVRAFAAAVAPSSNAVVETRITTVVVPAGRTLSEDVDSVDYVRAWRDTGDLLEETVCNEPTPIITPRVSYTQQPNNPRNENGFVPRDATKSTSFLGVDPVTSTKNPQPTSSLSIAGCFASPCHDLFSKIQEGFDKVTGGKTMKDPNDVNMDYDWYEYFCTDDGKTMDSLTHHPQPKARYTSPSAHVPPASPPRGNEHPSAPSSTTCNSSAPPQKTTARSPRSTNSSAQTTAAFSPSSLAQHPRSISRIWASSRI